jgi:hypothetical protein
MTFVEQIYHLYHVKCFNDENKRKEGLKANIDTL